MYIYKDSSLSQGGSTIRIEQNKLTQPIKPSKTLNSHISLKLIKIHNPAQTWIQLAGCYGGEWTTQRQAEVEETKKELNQLVQ